MDATEARRPWHALGAEEVLRALASCDAGLPPDEAARRLARAGPNAIARDEGPGLLALALRQLRDPIVLLLLGAAAVAALIGKRLDGAVVLGAIAVNVGIGIAQEWRAGRAIAALSRMVPELATVIRGGDRREVPAAELVPGDLVALAAGDRIPADARLLAHRGLHVEEAALTGESVPVAKALAACAEGAPLGDRSAMVFGGTHVTRGTAVAVVVATGAETELGRISELLRTVTDLETPLTRALARVGRWLTAGVLALGGALLAIALARGYGAGDALLVAIAIAVAAVPEGLPAIISISLAIGVQRMAARRAVVRHLPSVETLGATTVICSDKTGTLTRNEMTVQALWTEPGGSYELGGAGYAPAGAITRAGAPLGAPPADLAGALRAAALCNDAALRLEGEQWRVSGDPTEGALLTAAEKAGMAVEPLRLRWQRLDAIPFESERRFMATLHRAPSGGRIAFVKGAPEVVVPRCLVDAAGAEAIRARAHALAADGMRVLAVAERPLAAGAEALADADVEGGLRFLGLVAMLDPPRPEAIAAIADCRAAGIAVKMVTGDHPRTAEAIAARLGLAPPGAAAVTGAELAALDDAALRGVARASSVFARVAAEHKLRLVRALQADGQVVAMTGDGVNDAPALKQADVGVAMGLSGTAAAREAADVVLADDRFSTIAAAVEEGRRIHDNLVKALAFVLPTNLGLGFILVAAVLAFPLSTVDGAVQPLLPVLPTQLLWVNLVAAVTLSTALAFEVKEPDVMRRPPRPPGAPPFGRFVLVRTAVVAALMAAAAVGLFLWEWIPARGAAGAGRALAEARTTAVATVVAFQAFYLVSCRSLRGPLRSIGFSSNPAVFLGIALLAGLQAALVYLPPLQAAFGTAPLGAVDLALAVGAGAVVLPVVALEKRRAGPARYTQSERPPARRGPPAAGTARGPVAPGAQGR